jgi:hypothetical protein
MHVPNFLVVSTKKTGNFLPHGRNCLSALSDQRCTAVFASLPMDHIRRAAQHAAIVTAMGTMIVNSQANAFM